MSKNKLKHFCVECAEYSALAQSNKNSPQCTALSGDKSGVKIEPNEFPATVSIACQVKLNNNFSTAVYNLVTLLGPISIKFKKAHKVF